MLVVGCGANSSIDKMDIHFEIKTCVYYCNDEVPSGFLYRIMNVQYYSKKILLLYTGSKYAYF